MEEYRKSISDSFQKHLTSNYHAFCEKHGFEASTQHFITYLIDQELLSNATIKRYAIIKEFEMLYPKHDYHKSQTIETLADLFNLSSRHIWSLIKYSQRPEKRGKQGN